MEKQKQRVVSPTGTEYLSPVSQNSRSQTNCCRLGVNQKRSDVSSSGMVRIVAVPEWLLLLPIWLSDWLWATCGRSWQDWIGEPWPEGATLGAFSMFFISISSWWIQRSGGRRSFWLPFLLLALWLALFLHAGAQNEKFQRVKSETQSTTRFGFNIHLDALFQVVSMIN